MGDNEEGNKVNPLNFKKDKFDAYLKLADYWTNRYEQRHEDEWKVTLGLWAVILTGIISTDKLPPPPPGSTLLPLLSFVGLAYVVVWVIPILLKNKYDKQLANKYAAAGTALISEHKEPDDKETRPHLLDSYSVVFHALTTALLLLALSYSLNHMKR